jgi:hypothetical protein
VRARREENPAEENQEEEDPTEEYYILTPVELPRFQNGDEQAYRLDGIPLREAPAGHEELVDSQLAGAARRGV